MIGLAHFMLIPHQGVAIAVFCALMGIFALGVYPIALELIVECTYPVDQAIGTAFIFLSSALQGVFLMQIENALGYPLTEEEMQQQVITYLDPFSLDSVSKAIHVIIISIVTFRAVWIPMR